MQFGQEARNFSSLRLAVCLPAFSRARTANVT